MIDVKSRVLAALEGVEGAGDVVLYYPKSFGVLPCISYYEANNAPNANADDTEYLSEINYVIDVWGKTGGECTQLMLLADSAMNSIGFRREFSADVFDPKSDVRHKTSRYRFIGGN